MTDASLLFLASYCRWLLAIPSFPFASVDTFAGIPGFQLFLTSSNTVAHFRCRHSWHPSLDCFQLFLASSDTARALYLLVSLAPFCCWFPTVSGLRPSVAVFQLFLVCGPLLLVSNCFWFASFCCWFPTVSGLRPSVAVFQLFLVCVLLLLVSNCFWFASFCCWFPTVSGLRPSVARFQLFLASSNTAGALSLLASLASFCC